MKRKDIKWIISNGTIFMFSLVLFAIGICRAKPTGGTLTARFINNGIDSNKYKKHPADLAKNAQKSPVETKTAASSAAAKAKTNPVQNATLDPPEDTRPHPAATPGAVMAVAPKLTGQPVNAATKTVAVNTPAQAANKPVKIILKRIDGGKTTPAASKASAPATLPVHQ